MKRFILIILFLLNCKLLLSAEERSINFSTAQQLYSSSQLNNSSYPLNVKDNKYASLLLPNNTRGFYDRNHEGIIRLKIDHSNSNAFAQYNAEVNFEVTYEYFNGNVITTHSPITFKLRVLHDPLVNAPQQLDLQEYRILDAFNISLKIISIKDDVGNNITNVPDNLIVEAETVVERNYEFANPIPAITNYQIKNKDFDFDLDSKFDEVEFFWNYIPGAEEYELEWTFVNDYNYTSNLNLLTFSFNNNSTKIRLKENFYRIPLVFDRGYLIYRVRAVGLTQDWENDEFCSWSFPNNDDIISNVINSSTVDNISFYYNAGHELKFNWQYIATYAEEGKNKVVVNYMDNTFRSRQQLTKTNTNKEAIAGETVYDFQGRAAINILPVPTGQEPIKFYKNLNQNMTNIHYFWDDFDKDPSNPCNNNISPMNTNIGASRYYSPNNPDISMQQGIVPDAKGYPFVQTVYEPDNTGKVRTQGGAGDAFQIKDGGHYTSYLYGKPSQPELDRLFGSEAGFCEHYQKNAVIDPNGQASISYIDMYGKVVATSLAGVSPDSLIALDSNTSVQMRDDLLLGENHVSQDSNAVVFSKTFSVFKNQTPYNYSYSLDSNYFHKCLGPLCYSCVYNLTIQLVNNTCPNTIINLYRQVGTIDSLCHNNQTSWSSSVLLDIGNYTLTKTLSLNKQAIDTYASWYIDSLQDECFYPILPEAPDTNGCCWTCEKCKQSITSREEFISDLQTKFPDWNIESINIYYDKQVKLCKDICEKKSDCEIAYNSLLNDICPDGQYAQYKEDKTGKIKPFLFPVSVLNENNVLPGVNGSLPSNANWRHPYTPYLDNNGDEALINIGGNPDLAKSSNDIVSLGNEQYVRPENLKNLTDFIDNWQASFATSLLPYHPEYNYYLWCSQNDDPVHVEYLDEDISSNKFDKIIGDAEENIQSYKSFNDKGFFGNNSNSDADNFIALMGFDPFFMNGGLGNNSINNKTYYYLTNSPNITGYDLMLQLLQSYKRVPVPSIPSLFSTINVAQLAWMTFYCDPVYYGGQNDFCFPKDKLFRCDNNTPIGEFKDYKINPNTFKTYFSFYLICKKRVQEIMADEFSSQQNKFINQELPPYTLKPRGMYSALYVNDDESFITYLIELFNGSIYTYFDFEYEVSKYYNPIRNELIFPYSYNIENFPSPSYFLGIVPNYCNSSYLGLIENYIYLKNFYNTAHSVHQGPIPIPFINDPNPNNTYPDSRLISYFNAFPGMGNSYGLAWENNYNPNYNKKIRRFPKLNDSYGMIEDKYDVTGEDDKDVMESMQNEANKYWYETYGQCPLARDLQMLLNNIASYCNHIANNNLPNNNLGLASSNFKVSSRYFSNKLYDNLLGSNSIMEEFIWDAGSSNTSSLSASIIIGSREKIRIYLNGFNPLNTATINWDRIIYLSHLTATGPTSFTILTKYIDDNGINHEITLNGTIINIDLVNLDLYACTSLFNADCNTSDEAKALKDVLSTMMLWYQSGSITSSYSAPISSTTLAQPNLTNTIIQSKLKKYFYIPTISTQSLCYAVDVTTNIGNPTTYDYKIKIKTANNAAEMFIKFTTTDNLYYTLGYFYNLKHLNGTSNQFTIDYKYFNGLNLNYLNTYNVSVEYYVKYGSGNPIAQEFTAGACETSLNYSCRTPYHENFRNVQTLVKNIIKTHKLNDSFYLIPGNYINDKLMMNWANIWDLYWDANVINDTVFVNILGNFTINGSDTICSLWFANSIPALISSPTPYASFSDLTGFKLHPQFSNKNLSNYFQISVNDLSNNNYLINGHISCFELSDCILPCIPGQLEYKPIVTVDFENKNDFSTNFIDFQGPNGVYENNFYYNSTPPFNLNSGQYVLPINFIATSNNTFAGPYIYPFPVQQPQNSGSGRFFASHFSPSDYYLFIKKSNVNLKAGRRYKISFDYLLGEAPINIEINYENESSQQSIIVSSVLNLHNNWQTYISSPFSVTTTTNYDIKFKFNFSSIAVDARFYFFDNFTIMEEDTCQFAMHPFPDPPPKSVKDTCFKNMNNIAANNAYQRNKQTLDSLRQDFIISYKRKCLQTIESLWEETNNPEYHFTLYYYDQAGLLLKTIPPEGVSKYNDISLLQNIKIERLNGTGQSYFPPHRMATVYTYNSLNQLIKQKTPDAGITRFWYDKLGRIILSQNEKQLVNNAFSYTFYDEIGRIVEVGEATGLSTNFSPNNMMYNYSTFINDIMLTANRSQITHTYYDITPVGITTNMNQFNLRNRVSTVAIYASDADLLNYNYTHATHYSYDIHGNVNQLMQDNKYIGNIVPNERYKLIKYEYDLISGKVNKVIYQPGFIDQFMHRYEYDADNRLTHVFTSQDGKIWEKEAKYWYYKHGPLARTEIGDLEVQGMDFAYTIQGWIKGINSNLLDNSKDLGHDAKSGDIHAKFASDAASYSLQYFRQDFSPIDNNFTNFTASIENINSNLVQDAPGLYNGNISHMVTTIKNNSGVVSPQLTAYKYDQLNRIKQMRTYRDINTSTNKWNNISTNCYAENYSYDANGNIDSLIRYDATIPKMIDNLSYAYIKDANGFTIKNRLRHIKDSESSTNCNYDIDNQQDDNYTYDEIGNLTSDNSEGINNITWNVYGKISKIEKTALSIEIEFIYDAMGNRICKKVTNSTGTTYYYYSRDAQGNIMATYQYDNNIVKLKELDLYGSSRIGVKTANLILPQTQSFSTDNTYSRILGDKLYEISNHLGNVITTFTDRKNEIQSNGSIIGYNAVIFSSQDYYPFGMQMDGRGKNPISAPYRFAFNGKEKDDETYGVGNEYDYDARIYNPRIGRWLSVDPSSNKYSFCSPFNFCLNNPLLNTDPDGKDVWVGIKATGEHGEGHTVLAVTTYKKVELEVNGKVQTLYKITGIVIIENDPRVPAAIQSMHTRPFNSNELNDFNGIALINSDKKIQGKDLNVTAPSKDYSPEAFYVTPDQIKEESKIMEEANNIREETNSKFDLGNYNCTDYVSDIINRSLNLKIDPKIDIKTGESSSVSNPNTLFQNLKESGFQIIKNKGNTSTKAANDYISNYFKKLYDRQSPNNPPTDSSNPKK